MRIMKIFVRFSLGRASLFVMRGCEIEWAYNKLRERFPTKFPGNRRTETRKNSRVFISVQSSSLRSLNHNDTGKSTVQTLTVEWVPPGKYSRSD